MNEAAASRAEPKEKRSYGQVVRSTSILGGAQGLNYIIGMTRTKVVALLLGPTGIGLVALWQSMIELLAVVAGAGLGASGVREIAEATGEDDRVRAARTVCVIRRVCLVTGVLGALGTIAVAWPLSIWAFGSAERADSTAVLGLAVLFATLAAGQTALLQGVRRIGDLARASVLAMAASASVAVAVYYWLGERGIVPVLISTAVINYLLLNHYARKLPFESVVLGWRTVAVHARKLVGLGLAFMWGSLLTFGVALLTRTLIVREVGLDGNGIYQAAWGISGMFASFILSALGSDFYPRVAAAGKNPREVNQLVNEQIEVGILLGMPGLVGTLAFSPLLLALLYSSEFVAGATLLPWFVAGVFGRLIAWPMVLIMPALGASKTYAVTETCWNLLELALTIVLLRNCGLQGAAMAFALRFMISIVILWRVAHRLTGFGWSTGVLKLMAAGLLLIVAGTFAAPHTGQVIGFLAGVAVTFATGVYSLRGLADRLGTEHRLVRLACRLPGGRMLCGV